MEVDVLVVLSPSSTSVSAQQDILELTVKKVNKQGFTLYAK